MKKVKNLTSIFWLAVAVILLIQCSDSPTGPGPVTARKILFSSNRAGVKFDLWMMDPDGSNPERLTYHIEHEYEPSVTRDGRKVAYSDLRNIFILDLETGLIDQVTFGMEMHSRSAWSPDGSLLAYTSNKNYDSNLYIIKPGMTEKRVIPLVDYFVTKIDWSPDGERLLYSVQDSIESIFVLDIESGISEKVLDNARCGCWIENGAKISCITLPDYDIITYDPVTQEIEVLLEDKFAFTLSWLEDGTAFAYTEIIEETEFYDIFTFKIGDSAPYRVTNNLFYDRDPVWIEVNR